MATFFIVSSQWSVVSRITLICWLTRSFVRVRPVNFHKTFNFFERGKSEASVELVSVECSQHEPPQSLQLRMRQDCGDQPLAESPATKFLDDENVSQPGKGCVIRDHARKTDLFAGLIHSEAERAFDGAIHGLAGNAFRPVAALAEKIVDERAIQ